MRLYLIILIILLLPQINFAQEDFYKIINGQNHFPSIVEEAEAYFKNKHPGISPSELCQGEYRDGTFVKYMRWKSFWKSRLNEDGTLGDMTEYYRNKNNNSRSAGPFDSMEWTNLGISFNLGGHVGVGRTTGIDFHPTDKNVFIVATAVGGIWRTEDAGLNYQNIGDNLPTLAIGAVLMDHADPNIIYAATGDRVSYGLHGIGLYKSIDGGENWQETSLTWAFAEQIRIYKLVMHPEDSKIIFAATDKGLFKSKDGFATSEIVDSGLIHDVVFKPKDPSVVYFTTDNKFKKSIDTGESFETYHESIYSISRISVSEADPERVYFTKGNELFQSYNSGQNFSDPVDITELDNGSFGYVMMSNTNPDILYGGYFTTWKSENNGQSWNEITCFSGADGVHVDNHFAAQNPLEPGYIYFCNDGGLYKLLENSCQECSTCFGAYQDLSAGMFISQFYDISHSQQNINVVSGGTQDNSSYYRNKYGSWKFFAPTGDGMTNHIDPINDNYKYWEYQYGGMRRNIDGMNSCISCNIPNDEGSNGGWDTPYQLDPNNTEVMMAGFLRVYRSKDRGDTWKQVSSTFGDGELLDHLKIAPTNSDYVYVTESSNLYQTKTATNHTFLVWFQKALPFESPTELIVSQKNEETLYICRGDYVDGSKVYVSYDAGSNWENISGNLPNVPANAIVNLDNEDYDNVLIVGTDAGVFYKDASMDDWEEYGRLPHTYVTDIEIQHSSKLIRIGTHGRSMFEAPMPDNVCLTDNPPDSDGDGVCDAYDICPDGDDNLDLNLDGIPDDCEPSCFAAGEVTTVDNYINYFAFGAFTNISNKSTYSDFTHFTIQVEREETYGMEIGLENSFEEDNAFAWIDYNQDKEFTADERLQFSGFNDFHFAGTKFKLPADAKLGKTVLRIRNIGRADAPADPCGVYIGEVEDYGVEILEAGLTSIKSNGVNFGFELFPNPTKDFLNIKTQAYGGKELEMSIVSLDGRMVLQKETFQLLDGAIHSVDISAIPEGLYFVKLNAGKFSSVKKLVVGGR